VSGGAQGPRANDPGFLARARDVLFAPERGFQAVARHPSTFWQPLLLLALVNGLAITAFYDRLVVPEQLRAIEARGLGEAEAAEAEKIFNAPGTRIATIGVAVLGVPVVALVVAVVAHLAGGYLLGGSGTFIGSFAAVSYALLVGIVEWVAKLPVMLAQGQLEVFFGPALLLAAPDPTRFWDAFLLKLDVFSGWKAVLIGIGVAITHRIARRGPMVGFLLGLWILWAVVSALLGSAFAG
jgi:hypothetical protein